MKPVILIFTAAMSVSSIFAQTLPPGTISQPRGSAVLTNSATGSTSFTNAAGTAYSAEQLAGDLRDLRATVDRSLPVITAFTETYSNSTASESVAGRIEGLLSGARNRNSAQSSSQNSFRLTNLLSSVEGLLHTNSTASSPMNAEMIRDLATLQGQLQSVAATLQSLNVGATSTNLPVNPPPSPTGR